MKKAVVLFNLGGPDKLENVEPFLFNLFNDPAILNLPSFFRYPVAKLIANRRAPTAKKIYHLNLSKEEIAHDIILVGDPNRVSLISDKFDNISYKVKNREFFFHHTVYTV